MAGHPKHGRRRRTTQGRRVRVWIRRWRRLPAGPRRWLKWGGLLVLAYILALNLTVQLVGAGDSFVLSPFYLPQKTSAVAHLAWHCVRRPFLPPVPDPARLVRHAARRRHLPVSFVLALARAESGLEPHRISSTGAMGIMQLMPSTARQLGLDDPFDQAANITAGVRYLHRLWRRYGGDRCRVAAAYNSGPGAVPQTGSVLLRGETRAYVSRILGRRHRVCGS